MGLLKSWIKFKWLLRQERKAAELALSVAIAHRELQEFYFTRMVETKTGRHRRK